MIDHILFPILGGLIGLLVAKVRGRHQEERLRADLEVAEQAVGRVYKEWREAEQRVLQAERRFLKPL